MRQPLPRCTLTDTRFPYTTLFRSLRSVGVIVSTRGRHPASNSAFTATSDDIARGIPIAVLINGRSASASEMVAASLQDWGRAVVIGSATHGKGSVQNVARMPNGGELIITWSRMHAPSGYEIGRAHLR